MITFSSSIRPAVAGAAPTTRLLSATYPVDVAVGDQRRYWFMPNDAALTDGPWKTFRFRVRPIRQDYQNVLVNADVNKLVSTAEELLTMSPDIKKKNAFWEIFSKRTKASLHLLNPLEMAIIARAFDHHRKDTGIFTELATRVPATISEFSGLALVTIVDIFSRRLKRSDDTFKILASRLPSVMYQLTVEDLTHIIMCFHRAGYVDNALCRRTARKILAQMNALDAPAVANVSTAFGMQNFRSTELYNAIEQRAVGLAEDFDAPSMSRLLVGYNLVAIDCPKLLTALQDPLIDRLPKLSPDELSVIKLVVEDTEADVPALKENVTKMWEFQKSRQQPSATA